MYRSAGRYEKNLLGTSLVFDSGCMNLIAPSNLAEFDSAISASQLGG